MAKLFFVGDSITTGAWDEKGGWANRLIGQIMQETIKADFVENGFYCLPYNLGVSGDTVADILLRLENEVKSRLDPDNPDETVQLVFSIGVNDSVYMVKEDKPRFTDNEFRQNLDHLVTLSKEIAHQIAFVGLAPIDDDILNPIPWAPEKAYAKEHVKRFENIIDSVCIEHELPFLPLFENWISMPDYKSYLIDGVHPNSKGHELLAEQIGAFLINDDFRSFHSGA